MKVNGIRMSLLKIYLRFIGRTSIIAPVPKAISLSPHCLWWTLLLFLCLSGILCRENLLAVMGFCHRDGHMTQFSKQSAQWLIKGWAHDLTSFLISGMDAVGKRAHFSQSTVVQWLKAQAVELDYLNLNLSFSFSIYQSCVSFCIPKERVIQ